MIWLVEHFVVSYAVALFFVAAAYSLTWITGTHRSRGRPRTGGFLTPWRIMSWCLYFSLCSRALLLLHLKLDGFI